MRLLLFLLSFLFGLCVTAQEVKLGTVENKIQLGDLVGNRDLAFGVKNVLEEVVQDFGYDLNPNSNLEITVDILFFDVRKSNVQLALYQKNTDLYQIIARANLIKDGKKKKSVVAKGTAKSISTATLVVDEGGQFSQANVSTAIKKLCEQLVDKLKL
tara:strand:+ start:98 stop:568 length:471 start_codon:yes stop_codon:yes gene_type:complete